MSPDNHLTKADSPVARRSRRGRSPLRYERRRAEVIEAGAQLFARYGYEATSVGDIASAVGLLKGSLYYYAPSKEELLYTIIREVQDQGRRLVMSMQGTRQEPVEQLRELITSGAIFVLENPEKNLVSMRDYRSLSYELREDLRSDRTLYYRSLLRLLVQCQQDGVVRQSLDMKHTATAVLGAINYLPTWLERMEFDVESLGRSYADLFLGGLVAPSNGA